MTDHLTKERVAIRISLAGGTGVIGSRLIPELVAAGHEVVATTYHTERLGYLRQRGAQGVVVDVYDAPRLAAVLAEAAPDLVLHELTDMSDFNTEANVRLRRAGTANLVAAAQAAGVDRMMVQSISRAYQDGDAPVVGDDPIVPGSAVAEMEELAGRITHATMLRYGMLYGLGTWYAPGARVANVVTATVQAIGWPDGAYNIVDDEPSRQPNGCPSTRPAGCRSIPRGATASPSSRCGLRWRYRPAQYGARSWRLRSLPEPVRGSSFRKDTERGHL